MLQKTKTMLLISTGILSMSMSSPSHAWGQNGHRIVGEVAANHITDTTRQALTPLLDGESLPQIATWADEMRSAPETFWQKKSSRWHYINFDEGDAKPKYDEHAHHNKDSVTDILEGIEYSITVLKNDNASIAEKQFALRFLVHLVGDSHQPFHAGRGEDRGGNNISVTFFGQNTNLHSLWDTKLIENENLSYSEFAQFIDTKNEELIADYLSSSPSDWLIESHNIAKSIYKENETNISYSYIYKNVPVIKTRLQQGGIRLAGLLNSLFDKSAKPLVKALKMPTDSKL
ncbi:MULTISPECIES: S1/P1 nuclease [unclassified Pseudoalteromonas]|jgi:hypothetical protein|uniref:S1/P1 nuclease n=1 Tax=Pseudoalteromonas TaxID=53246 RepID=UPI0015D53D2F|nr:MULTISPECIES: S1/P1 nuclease [unclassified Pseudoalteromonas]QLJ10391.1 S1/P1 nuclease [Pseudoalteromonas sp. JSTW]QMW16581.1 S1/P1 nuclease [Pseudoalteromonas sp. MT33b]